MKKITIIIVLGFISIHTIAQELDDFYEKTFELYTPFCGMSSISKTQDSLGFDKSMNFWGVLDLGNTYSKSKPWGISFYCGERQMGDLFFLLKGMVIKSSKRKDFGGVYYLSDFGFLPNFRIGLNVIGKDNFVLNIGINNSYYITNGTYAVKNDWLSAGPNIYADKTITKWLAVRLATGPLFSYASGQKGMGKPGIWEHKIELFTKFGLFAGLDLIRFSKLHDVSGNEVKIRRYDLKLGVRIKV
jgi:hypothetical protein